jgi:hypothetical protein
MPASSPFEPAAVRAACERRHAPSINAKCPVRTGHFDSEVRPWLAGITCDRAVLQVSFD